MSNGENKVSEIVGRAMTRRGLLRVLGVTSMGVLAAACAPTTPPPAPTAAPAAKPTAAPAQQAPAAAKPTTAPAAAATTAPAAAAAAKPAAGQPRIGGHLRTGTNGEAANIHPLLRVDTDGDYMTDWVFDRVVDLDPKTLEPVGHLAKSWTLSPDGKTYTFTFRDDVKWHDGKPFTAEDVAYSLGRIQAEDYTGPFKARFADVESVRVTDPMTMVLILKQPNAPFLASSMRELKPIPKHLSEGQDLRTGAYANQLIGTGPFKFDTWQKGSHFSFKANTDYWGGRPYVDQVTHRVITDMNSLVATAESGAIDFLIMPVPSELKRIEKEGKLNTVILDPYIPESIHFNLETPTLKDARVRKAIAHALDMKSFTEQIMLGVVGPADGVVMPYLWAYDPQAKMPTYNLDQAKKLLAEAGMDKGFTVKMDTNAGNAFREAFVTYAQAQLARLNIKVDIVLSEWPVFLKKTQTFDYEIGVQTTTAGYPEPDFLSLAFHSKGVQNYTKYNAVDKLLEDARVTSDQAKRKEIYSQVQRKIVEDLPVFYTFYRPNPLVTSKKLNGLQPTPLSPYYGISKWWLDG